MIIHSIITRFIGGCAKISDAGLIPLFSACTQLKVLEIKYVTFISLPASWHLLFLVIATKSPTQLFSSWLGTAQTLGSSMCHLAN